MVKLLYEDITGHILTAARRVFNHLPHMRGYREKALARVLAQELRTFGHQVQTEVRVTHQRQGEALSKGWADLVVDNKVAVELKKVEELTPDHEDQLYTYMLAGGWPVGMVLNFGGVAFDFRRCYERRLDPTRQRRPNETVPRP